MSTVLIQHEVVYNQYLPYAVELDNESTNLLSEIKRNLTTSVLSHELQSAVHWVSQLKRYITLHGYKFSKGEHVGFINLLLEIILAPGLDFTIVSAIVPTIEILLRKMRLVSPQDLSADWRRLYKLYEKVWRCTYSSNKLHKVPSGLWYSVGSLIRTCNPYFCVESTQEMLKEWRPLLCPFDTSMGDGLAFLETFLPTLIPPQHHSVGFKLWFDEIMTIWNVCCHNCPDWEMYIISLFSRLAAHNIGYIDWKPYVPKIFTRLLRSFNLPIGQNTSQSIRVSFNVDDAAKWIVSMMGGDCSSVILHQLERLFRATDSFSHPSNHGLWSFVLEWLVSEISHELMNRVHRERFKRPSWITPVPADCQLTDDDVTAFVNVLQPRMFLLMFGKGDSCMVSEAFQNLALLRPAIIIPPLLDRTFPAFETLIEPHRLNSCLQCVAAVCCSLVNSVDAYPAGRTHVIYLLNLCLPGIDSNDIDKCLNTFHVLAKISSLVPLVVCPSTDGNDLTLDEVELCRLTTQFQDFMACYIDKVCNLIDNSGQSLLEEGSQTALTTEEIILRAHVSSTTAGLLHGASLDVFNIALNKVQNYLLTAVFDIHASGLFAAGLLSALVKAQPEPALKVFIPHFVRIIKKHEASGTLDSEQPNAELLWSSKALAQTLSCDSSEADFMPYVAEIVSVLSITLHQKCLQGSDLAASMLCNLLRTLGTMYPREYRTCPLSSGESRNTTHPIRGWGSAIREDELHMTWHIPSAGEIQSVGMLLEKFLVPELASMHLVAAGTLTWTREQRRQSLCIVNNCLSGASYLLEPLPGDQLLVSDFPLSQRYPSLVAENRTTDCFFNSENLRLKIIRAIRPLLAHVLSIAEDDTKSLLLITEIYQAIVFLHGFWRSTADLLFANVQHLKKMYRNKLMKEKQNIRGVLINIVTSYHSMRVADRTSRTFTENHRLIVRDLFTLATSRYKEVSTKAQAVLNEVHKTFIGSHKITLGDVVACLSETTTSEHQLKGVLYHICGNDAKNGYGKTSNSSPYNNNWSVLAAVWPAVLNLHLSDRVDPSVDEAIDHFASSLHLGAILLTNFYRDNTSTTCADGYQSMVRAVAVLLLADEPVALLSSRQCAESAAGVLEEQKRDEEAVRLYKSLVDKLVKYLQQNSGKKPKFYQMALHMLMLLVRHDVKLPKPAVDIFLSNAVHDKLQFRQYALAALPLILKQQKRHKTKDKINPFVAARSETEFGNAAVVPGDRPDNAWLQYRRQTVPDTEDAWNNCIFVDKTHWGYYCWPSTLEVCLPNQHQSLEPDSRNNMVLQRFQDSNFVNKLICFLSTEEHRVCNSFSTDNFKLFKGLFQNFESDIAISLRSLITDLVNNADLHTREHAHRCAAEIVAALIRGSMRWSYGKLQLLWQWLLPLVRTVLDTVSVETLADWQICISLSMTKQDGRKLSGLIELLMTNPIRGSAGSFGDSSRLSLLQEAIIQLQWRAAELHTKLVHYLGQHMTFQYKNVRDKVASTLACIFCYDLRFPSSCSPHPVHLPTFSDGILQQLAFLMITAGSPLQVQDWNMLSMKSPAAFDERDRIAMSFSVANDGVPVASNVDLLVSDMEIVHGNESTDSISMPLDKLAQFKETRDSLTRTKSQASSVLIEDFTIEAKVEEKKAIQLCRTVLKMMQLCLQRCSHCVAVHLLDFLPVVCQLERDTDDDELRAESSCVLFLIGQTAFTAANIPALLAIICQVAIMESWHARESLMRFCQVLIFSNLFVLSDSSTKASLQDIIIEKLEDTQVEVREAAAVTLSGLFQCNYLSISDNILNKFKSMAVTSLANSTSHIEQEVCQRMLRTRHAGVLGLSACILAHPYDISHFMPNLLVTYCRHLHDPQPIQATVKNTVASFKRTHQDSWHEHRARFSDDQLVVVNDLIASPNYYA